MRASLPVVLVLLGTALVAPLASAAPLLSDPRGDVAMRSSAGPLAFSNAATDAVDLLSLDLVESEDALAFTLTMAGADSATGASYAIHFTWSGVEYRAIAESYPNFDGGRYMYAELERLFDEDFEPVAELEAVLDGATLAMTVPKLFILDAKDRPLAKDGVLEGLHARATQCCNIRISGNSAQASDVMPDDGAGVDYVAIMGEVATGDVRAASPDPIRVSNGGATTFVFRVLVANTGAKDAEYRLAAVDLPEGWNASVQSPIRVPAGEDKDVIVLASVPFAHTHGGFDAFNVTVEHATDPGTKARVRLGVLHTPIPQPAGHHPDLFLHAEAAERGTIGSLFSTAFPYNFGYMNTDSERADGEQESMTMNGCSDDGCGWYIGLSPQLAMGLDFDLAREGQLVGAIMPGGTGESTLRAALYLYGGERGDSMLLATSSAATVALDPQSPTPFQLTLTPTEDADYIPYAPDQNVYLELIMEEDDLSLGCCFLGNAALSAKDFKLTLPLNEYHDRLTGASEVAEALDLVAEGAVEKAGRPGTLLTYSFTLTNGFSEPLAVDVDTAGADAVHGTVVPEGELELAPGESRKVTLAVRIPADANEGESFEVLVFVHAEDDPSLSAIARTKTLATLKDDATPDETQVLQEAQSEERKDTPAPALPALALAVALAALVTRRRR